MVKATKASDIKGTISDRQFQISFFQTPTFFCILIEYFAIIAYLHNNSLRNRIFLVRETIIGN